MKVMDNSDLWCEIWGDMQAYVSCNEEMGDHLDPKHGGPCLEKVDFTSLNFHCERGV